MPAWNSDIRPHPRCRRGAARVTAVLGSWDPSAITSVKALRVSTSIRARATFKGVLMSTDVLIVNLVVLGAVLWADLGTKAITRRRIRRPVVVSAIAVAIFLKSPQTSGNGLTLELAGLAAGLALGAVGSRLLMRISRDPSTGEQVSIAGLGYGALWTAAIGARLLFTYGANHWYSQSLGHWMAANRVSVDGLTDALILFAIGMVLARVIRFAHAVGAAPDGQSPALSSRGSLPTHRTAIDR